MKTYIVHGPAGCGKTTHADQIADKLGCAVIVDDWYPPKALTPGAIHITYCAPPYRADKLCLAPKIIDYLSLGLPDLRKGKGGRS